jgi:hypothetical protein
LRPIARDDAIERALASCLPCFHVDRAILCSDYVQVALFQIELINQPWDGRMASSSSHRKPAFGPPDIGCIDVYAMSDILWLGGHRIARWQHCL